jgi:hypothetical protein
VHELIALPFVLSTSTRNNLTSNDYHCADGQFTGQTGLFRFVQGFPHKGG